MRRTILMLVVLLVSVFPGLVSAQQVPSAAEARNILEHTKLRPLQDDLCSIPRRLFLSDY